MIAAADGERAAAVLAAAGFDSMDDFQGAEVADLEDIAGFSDLPSIVQRAIRDLPRLAERCVEERRRLQPVDTQAVETGTTCAAPECQRGNRRPCVRAVPHWTPGGAVCARAS